MGDASCCESVLIQHELFTPFTFISFPNEEFIQTLNRVSNVVGCTPNNDPIYAHGYDFSLVANESYINPERFKHISNSGFAHT